MSVKFTYPSSVTVTGTTYENEPIIKSDAASSDIMEWQASTGSSTVKLREGSGNTVVLDVDGSLELADKIKSVTSATTVGAVHIYDTSQDSDGGAWRKKCKGLSWFDEAASATRSARSEFPAMALIVCDHDGTAGTTTKSLTIYDLDDPAMPLWMKFNVETGFLFPRSGGNYNMARTVHALNGRLYCGVGASSAVNWGYFEIDFTNDSAFVLYSDSNYSGPFNGTISERNTAKTSVFTGGAGNLGPYSAGIVNNAVNDVAATVLEGAEIGALGLPIPTVAVATGSGTAGGFSVIHSNGDVYSKTTTGTLISKVAWSDDSLMVSQTDYAVRFSNSELYASASGAYPSSFTNGGTVSIIGHFDRASVPNLIGTAANDNDKGFVVTGGNDMATGSATGLTRVKWNEGNAEESAVAYITSDYNTGYMVGDIRGAYFAQSKNADRSVKANTMALTGAITDTAVATGAETLGYSGWSASNYLSRAYDADFDFDTGDFSITLWAKWTANSTTTQVILDRFAVAGSGARILLYDDSSNGNPKLYVSDGSSSASITASSAFDDGSWHQIVAVRRNSSLCIYVDGVDAQTTHVANTYDLDSGTAVLTVGEAAATDAPFVNGSLSLLRISATAPTPQQIKEIYEAEKPLFAANAKGLLQSDDGSYSNQIRDLAFDKSSGILSATQYSGTTPAVTKFRGLEAVDTFNGKDHGWTDEHTHLAASAGGVSAFSSNGSGGGVLVDLPALDVRAELNEGEDKLPDDGKLHFSGVTTDASPLIIAQIPMAANERMIVRAKVEATEYQNFAGTSEWFHGEVRRQYRCDMSGARDQDAAVDYKYSDSYTSTMDIDLGHNSSNTAVLKVTGVAGTRIEWTASVEVQRISEKKYER